MYRFSYEKLCVVHVFIGTSSSNGSSGRQFNPMSTTIAVMYMFFLSLATLALMWLNLQLVGKTTTNHTLASDRKMVKAVKDDVTDP